MEPFKEGFEDIQQGKSPSTLMSKIMTPLQKEIDKIQENKDNLYLNKILQQGLKDAEHLNKFIQPLKDGFNQGQKNNPNADGIKSDGGKDNKSIHDTTDQSSSITKDSIENIDKTENSISKSNDKTNGSKT
jgi:hypothetical protein